jgi:hypothetical protein
MSLWNRGSIRRGNKVWLGLVFCFLCLRSACVPARLSTLWTVDLTVTANIYGLETSVFNHSSSDFIDTFQVDYEKPILSKNEAHYDLGKEANNLNASPPQSIT